MRTFTLGLVFLVFTGCAATGPDGKPVDTVTRVLADIGCVSALINAGGQIAGDPTVGGAKTVLDIFHAISVIGASNIPATVMSACAASLAYLTQDASGAQAYVTSVKGTTSARVGSPPTVTRPPEQPNKPTMVTVTVPR